MGASLDRGSRPRISIVTANYNGEAHLARAMESVLCQDYPDLEYIVMDGGSTDRSCHIIESFSDRLAHWESAPDEGFADAYNKGFARATGDILAYLNADDAYCPWAFDVVARCFSDVHEIEWLTTLYPMLHGVDAEFVAAHRAQPYDGDLFYAGRYGESLWWIQQESTFWRRSLWERAGGYLDASLNLAIDAELWSRFFEQAELYAVATPLAGFRKRPDSKSGRDGLVAYRSEFATVLERARRRQGSGARRLEPLLRRVRSGRRTGKTVHWNHAENRYVARSTRIELP